MKKVFKIDLDVVAASASILCAIHCALVPLVMTFGLLSGLQFVAHGIWDVVFIISAIILAFTSLANGYRNHHQRWYPSAIAAFGFFSFLIGHMLISGFIGDIMSVIGGLLIATAHIVNYNACRTCKKCRN